MSTPFPLPAVFPSLLSALPSFSAPAPTTSLLLSSPGLSLPTLGLSLYLSSLYRHAPSSKVVILSASHTTRNALLSYFTHLQLPSHLYTTTTATRHYNSFVHFLSPSSFILDLLTNSIDPTAITGLIIYDCHRGIDGTQTMIARVLQSSWDNANATPDAAPFIICATTAISFMTKSLQSLLKSYAIPPPNMLLYPRFRLTSLPNLYFDTLTIPVPATTSTLTVAILTLITQLVGEIKRHAAKLTLSLDSTFHAILTGTDNYEYLNILPSTPPTDGKYLSTFTGFPYNGLWTNVFSRSAFACVDGKGEGSGLLRAYFADLASLSNLLAALETESPINFHSRLNILYTSIAARDASSFASTGWVTSAAGLDVLQTSEARIGAVDAGVGPTAGGVFVPQELCETKLAVLVKLLDEIDETRVRRNAKRERGRKKCSPPLLASDLLSSCETLVLCDTSASAAAIASALRHGITRHANIQILDYLEKKNEARRCVLQNDLKIHERLSMRAETRLRDHTFSDYSGAEQRDPWIPPSATPDATPDPQAEFSSSLLTQEHAASTQIVTTLTFEEFESSSPLLYLRGLRPQHIILYDGDVAAVRTIEQYSETLTPTGENKHEQLRVYYLHYNDSITHYSYLRQIRRENEAWERIIETKRTSSNNRLTQTLTEEEISLARDISALPSVDGALSRVGKGRARPSILDSVEGRTVAVDVREFRSGLPAALHSAGLRLAPLTLTVGDYVISKNVVVERKAPGDLRSSLNSGRLYSQMEAMDLYYKIPTLLVEFDDSKRNGEFTLMTDANDLMSEPRTESIISKLAVLTMKFNRARYLWARNPKETVEVFKAIKAFDNDVVDCRTAVEFGGNDEVDKQLGVYEDGGAEDDDDEGANSTAVALLVKLPGVNTGNVKKIMALCDNLAELSELSKEELKLAMGVANANRLWSFFRVKMNDKVTAVEVSGGAGGGKKRKAK